MVATVLLKKQQKKQTYASFIAGFVQIKYE